MPPLCGRPHRLPPGWRPETGRRRRTPAVSCDNAAVAAASGRNISVLLGPDPEPFAVVAMPTPLRLIGHNWPL